MYVVHPDDVRSEPSPPHGHDAEDQVYIVQSGRAVAEVGDERRGVGPGDLVYVPRGSRHSLAALGDASVVLYSRIHEIARRE